MCRLCTILLFLLVASTSIAANQPNRVALVIGNAAYKEAPLRNPVNDARAIGQTPQRPDFQVTTRLNADHDAMQTSVVSFADRPEYYQAYLERYPNGAFAPLARLHIDRLAGEAPTASSSA